MTEQHICPNASCEHVNAADANFCSRCGAALVSSAPTRVTWWFGPWWLMLATLALSLFLSFVLFRMFGVFIGFIALGIGLSAIATGWGRTARDTE